MHVCQLIVQLDFCSKMAGCLTRASAGNIMWFPVSICLDDCNFSRCGTHCLGMLVNLNTGSRYNWFGCDNGGHCSYFGILFNHALVANTMAKLK